MKKIIFTLSILIFAMGKSDAQNSPCINGVSTNPQSPINQAPYLPNNISPYTDYGALFLNNFNWIPFTSQGTMSSFPTNGLNHLGNNQFMLPLYNPSLGHSSYYQYIRDEVIMPNPVTQYPGYFPNHQNGWELIGVNLGFFPNGTAYSEIPSEINHFERIPYVILYNRYLSKIRVFANVGNAWAENNAYQAVRIRLTLNTSNQNELNGLFRLQSGLDQSLDLNTTVRSAGALAEIPNDKQRWFSADFPVAYDPCVCDYSSAINVSFELIKNLSLKLYGRGISVEEDIVDADGNLINNDFFAGFSVPDDAVDFNHGGFVMYEKMENVFQDYLAKMEAYDAELDAVGQHNKRVKRNIAIVKIVELIVRSGVAILTSGTLEVAAAKAKLVEEAADMVDDQNPNSEASGTSGGVKWEKVLKEGEKILGKEIATWISKEFKEKNPPAVPNKPTANFTEMYFEGQIQLIDEPNGPTFYTPGTYGNSINENIPEQHHYPVYNEPLGVFALLEKPKLKYSTYDWYVISILQTDTYFINYGSPTAQTEIPVAFRKYDLRKSIQYALDAGLKYHFNPALNIEKHDIQASIELFTSVKEGETIYPIEEYSFGNIDFQQWHYLISNPNLCANVQSTQLNIDEVEEIYVGQNNFENGLRYQGLYVPIDAFNNFTYAFGYSSQFVFPTTEINLPSTNPMWNQDDWNHWQLSPYGEPAYSPSMFNRLSGKNSRYIDMDSAYLKLIVNVEFADLDTDGNKHKSTFFLTYKIEGDDIVELPLSNWLPSPIHPNFTHLNLTQYPENLILNNVLFHGSPVDGCTKDGYTYTCKAWNDIEIYGVISVAPNYQLIVEAGNEIIQHPESVVNPESILRIVPFLDFSNPMPPVSSEYVGNFCKPDNLYNANRAAPHIQAYYDSLAQANPPQLEEKAPIEFIVFPNPTTGASQAGLSLPELATVSISIVDITGKVQGRPVQNQVLPMGRNVLNLESEPLAPGVYFVQVVVNGEKLTQRLVKQ